MENEPQEIVPGAARCFRRRPKHPRTQSAIRQGALIHVLFVEDNEAEASLIREILAESLLPLELRFARDGMEALFMLSEGSFLPDLIVVDLHLPYISGHGVIERFHPRDVPIVAFTSSSDESDRRRALELGARDFVRKPMDLQEYTTAVRGIVEKWGLRKPGP